MRKLSALLMFILASAIVYPQMQNFSPELLNSCVRLGDPQISPESKLMLYRWSKPDIPNNTSEAEIRVVNADGTNDGVVIPKEYKAYNAIWFPDGKSLAFISGKEGVPQAYRMTFPNGEPELITNIENGVSNLAISPDGKYISFTSEIKIKQTILDKHPDLPKANARLYNDLPVRHWDHWEDEMYSHLFLQKLSGGDPLDIMPAQPYDTPLMPFGGGEEIAWAPDGSEIAYTCKKVEDFELSTNSDVYVYKLSARQTLNITDGMQGFDKHPLYSPDGNWIAFASQERAGFESDKIRLMLYNRRDKSITELSSEIDQWIQNFAWAPDSKSLYIIYGEKGTVQAYNINIDDKSLKQLTEGRYNYDAGLSVSPDGGTLILGRRTMQRPTEFFALDITSKKLTQLTKANDELFSKIKPVEIEERWIESFDGAKVHCWILYPPDFNKSKKYPMITYCQGGPQSMISQYFSYRWNLFIMASHGYVVLAPNRRGMPGFGQEWNDAISKDWGGKPMDDILAATDELMKEDFIDKEAVAAVGASAGGYATFWLAGNHEGRFAALVSHCGVFNFESMYGSTEELWFPDWEYGGPYWKGHIENYNVNSPHNYAANWDTPILITFGENDFRVPYTQSLEAFTVAQVNGVPSRLISFPGENHWILKPQNSILWQREFFDFLDTYCKNN